VQVPFELGERTERRAMRVARRVARVVAVRELREPLEQRAGGSVLGFEVLERGLELGVRRIACLQPTTRGEHPHFLVDEVMQELGT